MKNRLLCRDKLGTNASKLETTKFNLTPPAGISLGWASASYSRNNTIVRNLVDQALCGRFSLADGGSLYSLGAQPNSSFRGNYIRNQCHSTAAICETSLSTTLFACCAQRLNLRTNVRMFADTVRVRRSRCFLWVLRNERQCDRGPRAVRRCCVGLVARICLRPWWSVLPATTPRLWQLRRFGFILFGARLGVRCQQRDRLCMH